MYACISASLSGSKASNTHLVVEGYELCTYLQHHNVCSLMLTWLLFGYYVMKILNLLLDLEDNHLLQTPVVQQAVPLVQSLTVVHLAAGTLIALILQQEKVRSVSWDLSALPQLAGILYY